MRATSPTDNHHSHGKHRGTILSTWEDGREGEGGRECHVTENFLVQKKKRANDSGRTFLKLCWVMIG